MYKASHYTETALIRVKDDILRVTDNQRVMHLILLNLSVAFDTVSHPFLLNWFQHRFSIQGTILKWIENYMLDHSQRVLLEDSNNRAVTSDGTTLKQGVPQGSVLGPILFTLYISPLGDICWETWCHIPELCGWSTKLSKFFSCPTWREREVSRNSGRMYLRHTSVDDN